MSEGVELSRVCESITCHVGETVLGDLDMPHE